LIQLQVVRSPKRAVISVFIGAAISTRKVHEHIYSPEIISGNDLNLTPKQPQGLKVCYELTSKRPGWYLNFGALLSENHEYYFEQKMIKLRNK